MGSRLSSSGGSSTTDASALTTGTLPLARLSGITTTQLDAAAGITSAQIAALDAAKITTGTLPLARLSGITTSQLAAGAAITSGQIASVAAATITGTNTLPDGVLSTNVPLLNAANTFTAAQVIAGSVAASKVLILRGAASQSGNLLECQDSTSALKGQFTLGVGFVVAAGLSFKGTNFIDTAGTGAYLATSATDLTANARSSGNIPLICKGAASQSADLAQWQDSAAHTQFGIMNGGSGGSPVWALRVRATANAESMAVSHTAGAATGKCIQVFDDAGVSLGYIALFA